MQINTDHNVWDKGRLVGKVSEVIEANADPKKDEGKEQPEAAPKPRPKKK